MPKSPQKEQTVLMDSQFGVVHADGKAKVALKSRIKHVFNQRYSTTCTHDQAQCNKLSSYFLANAISSQDSKQLIANAW